MRISVPFCMQAGFALAVMFAATEPLLGETEAPAVDLSARAGQAQTQSVTVELTFGGELKLETQASGPEPGESATPEAVPVSVAARLSYDEHFLDGERPESIRYYRSVAGTTKVANRADSPQLRDNRRLVLAEIGETGRRLCAVDGPLNRQELETLKLPADTLALGRLLPEGEVAPGDTWHHDSSTMQAFTGLDSIGVCEVSSVLTEANDSFARCQLAGAVHGVTSGASVEMELEAVYLVDLKSGKITRLNLAIRETREIGPATPGLDGVAKLKIAIEPVGKESPLTSERVAQASKRAAEILPMLETRSSRLGFATLHGSGWHSTGVRGEVMTLRLVASEGLVAHGNISRLPPEPLDPERALPEFRSDVMHSLGEGTKKLVAEEQWTNEHGCRVVGVVAEGEVGGVALEWHSYLVAPPEDDADLHRLAITFTVEETELAKLASEARDLVDQIELFKVVRQQAKKSTARK